MKLSIVLLFTLMVSNSVTAQVVTGGKMALPIFATPFGILQIGEFEKHLVKKHTLCPSAGIKLTEPDLMDSYLKLALLRATNPSDENCGKVNAYLKCMNDSKTIELSKVLKESSTVKIILMAKYKISSNKVDQILYLFSTLDKKIE